MVLSIKGIQKISLLDYPNKIASTIFLGGCNFRCPSCHNPSLVFDKGEILDKEEILETLEKRKDFIEGVCLTGGEPLISELEEFIKKIKQKGLLVKLDTNGSFPEKLKELIKKKLIDYVALDVKAPPVLYSNVAGVKVDIKKIEKSIKLISDSGIDYEFRTTVCAIIKMEKIYLMTCDEVESIVKWLVEITESNKHRYYLQPFIPRKGNLIDSRFEEFPETPIKLLKEIQKKIIKYLPDCKIR